MPRYSAATSQPVTVEAVHQHLAGIRWPLVSDSPKYAELPARADHLIACPTCTGGEPKPSTSDNHRLPQQRRVPDLSEPLALDHPRRERRVAAEEAGAEHEQRAMRDGGADQQPERHAAGQVHDERARAGSRSAGAPTRASTRNRATAPARRTAANHQPSLIARSSRDRSAIPAATLDNAYAWSARCRAINAGTEIAAGRALPRVRGGALHAARRCAAALDGPRTPPADPATTVFS